MTEEKAKEQEMAIRVDELMKEWATYCHSQEPWKNAILHPLKVVLN